MPKARNTKPPQRGPKKERLVITQDPQETALRQRQVADLKTRFDEIHRDGMDALKRRDYDALVDAIEREREIADVLLETTTALRKRTK